MNTVKSRLSARGIKLLVFGLFMVMAGGGCDYILPNKPPYVKKTAPADSASFTIGQEIVFQVNAYDMDGSVIQVEFTPPDTVTYIDDTAPYEFVWRTAGMTAGIHRVEIKAVDNRDEPYIISVPVILLGSEGASPGRDARVSR